MLIHALLWRDLDLSLYRIFCTFKKRMTNLNKKNKLSIEVCKKTVSKPLKPQSFSLKKYNKLHVF